MADVLGTVQIQALPAATLPVAGTELTHIKQGTGDRRISITDLMYPHTNNKANPHNVTKTQVGLSNVTNDLQLKVSANLSDVLDKAAARANLVVYSTAESDAKLKVHTDRVDNPHLVTKSQVGLSNVPNYTVSTDFRENADKFASAKSVAALFTAIQNQNPVGDIHISYNPANPTTYLLCGGTWVLEGQGKTLVGFVSGDTTRTVGSSFGAQSKLITTQNLPRHTHTVTLSGGDHVHRILGSTQGAGAHAHSFSGSTSVFDYDAKYGTTSADGYHQHTGTTDMGGNHRHMFAGDDELIRVAEVAQNQIGRYDADSDTDNWARNYWTSWSGDHQHSFTTNAAGQHQHTVGIYIGAHSHTFSGSTSAQDNHQHGIDFNSQNSAHTHSGTTDQTGGDVAFNVEQPSLVVYIWRRTA